MFTHNTNQQDPVRSHTNYCSGNRAGGQEDILSHLVEPFKPSSGTGYCVEGNPMQVPSGGSDR